MRMFTKSIDTVLESDIAVIDELIDMSENLLETQSQNKDENQQYFDELSKWNQGTMQLRRLIQAQIKREIEVLQNDYDSCYGQGDKTEKLKELVSQEEQLRQEYCTVQENQKELSLQCKALEKAENQIKKEHETLTEEKERRDNETTVVLPLKREALGLLTLISGIRLDFEGSDDKLEGFITNKQDVKTFSYSKTSNSQFTITNSLWDLMTED